MNTSSTFLLTCISLLQVTIGSIAAALLGFAGSDGKKEHQPTENLVEIIAMILLPVAVLMVAYALMVFVWRSKAIAKKQVGSSLFKADAFFHFSNRFLRLTSRSEQLLGTMASPF